MGKIAPAATAAPRGLQQFTTAPAADFRTAAQVASAAPETPEAPVAPTGAAAAIAGASLVTAPPALSPSESFGAKGKVELYSYDAKTGEQTLIRSTGEKPSGDAIGDRAFDNALQVDGFLRGFFKRDGIDGKGGPMKVLVHAPDEDGSTPMLNARWYNDSQKLYIGDGDNVTFAPLGDGLDVMAHESFHGVVDAEVKLRYSGQQGGLHESFADVFATVLDKDDWQIGEDIYTPNRAGDAIRDLSNPRFQNVSQLPKDVELNVYDLSAIPSLAAVKVADVVGRDAMGQIWYRALNEHLKSNSGYAGAARSTLTAAAEMHGQDSKEFAAVADAWKAVGVNPRWTPARTRGLVEAATRGAALVQP